MKRGILALGLIFAAQSLLAQDWAKARLNNSPRHGEWVEIICGFLVAFGLLTRIAAFVASGEMAVAFFMVHAPKGLIPYVNKGELAVVYCFVFFYIFLRGPGSWSIDAMIGRGRTATAAKL